MQPKKKGKHKYIKLKVLSSSDGVFERLLICCAIC